VIIQWLGHACFKVTLANGKVLLTDPFDETLGYPEFSERADWVTVSHQHWDHNAVNSVSGEPKVFSEEGQSSEGEVIVKGVGSFHDAQQGVERGNNIIFVIEAEGLKICHLGDLGHMLDRKHVEKIGSVDIVMVPVGGHFTIDAEQAQAIVGMLTPKYVLPMHYKTDFIGFPIKPVDEFLKYYPKHSVQKELNVEKGSLPDSLETIVLK